MQHLLNHLPAGLLLLVTSRQRPSWHLARWRLSELILEINEQDLRFSPIELQALLTEQGHMHVSAATVQNILLRSEGWAAGLRLWLLALNGRADNKYALLAGPHGSQGLIREYLLEEIIAQQPQSIQQFLYATATLERFNAGLCDAVRERQDSAQIIEYLLAYHVFFSAA